jgi:nucleotide-binding universal stress UspA family protein
VTAPTQNTILIAYDGSISARAAIERAGRLFPGSPALVVTVWSSVRAAAGAARAALPADVIDEAVGRLDQATEAAAVKVAEDGAARARQAGLKASSLAIDADGSIWAAIVRLAEEEQVLAVVVGSRGQSSLRSALLGSVSNAVVHRCGRPVVVVQPEDEASGEV